MSEPAAPTDPLSQMMLNNIPETVEDMRNMLDGFAGMLNGDMPEVGAFHEKVAVEGLPAEVTADVIVPKGDGPFPVLVYLHGGGWICGSPTTHNKLAHRFAEAGYLVLNVDYRLAPEHVYPAAPDDAFAALQWVGENARELGGDPGRIAVGGDSAGGNLAAVVALLARDAGGPALRFQLLVYPAVDLRAPSRFTSRKENREGPFLTLETMEWFESHYFASEEDRVAPNASPLLASSHAKLPPALVVTAEFDPLRDEGEAYAKALQEAGVETTLHRYDGMPHMFFQLGVIADAGKELLAEAAAALKNALAR